MCSQYICRKLIVLEKFCFPLRVFVSIFVHPASPHRASPEHYDHPRWQFIQEQNRVYPGLETSRGLESKTVASKMCVMELTLKTFLRTSAFLPSAMLWE
jgi:hypothetical protein